jgi:hypothetical protein
MTIGAASSAVSAGGRGCSATAEGGRRRNKAAIKAARRLIMNLFAGAAS